VYAVPHLVIRVFPAISPVPTVAAVSGEVDRCSAPELVRRLGGLLDAGLVLDLSRVGFLDVGGLRALLALDARLHSAGHRLVLAAVSHPVRLILDNVELEDPFATSPTVDRAVAQVLTGCALESNA
jgi:anti-sigma B factor antagonist